MFTKTLLPDTFRAIQLSSQIRTVREGYLAGGTALALQLGHRISIDLDFFTNKEFEEDAVIGDLSKYPEFELKEKAWRIIISTLCGAKFSFFYYKYPLLEETIEFEGIKLAGKKDIAAMKVHALYSRGTRRDFFDIFLLAKSFTLEEMFNFYDKKYNNLANVIYPIIRSLNYFEDADNEKGEPKMLVDLSWEEVKEFFQKESMRLAKEKLNLPVIEQ